jgi:hypothetical protein
MLLGVAMFGLVSGSGTPVFAQQDGAATAQPPVQAQPATPPTTPPASADDRQEKRRALVRARNVLRDAQAVAEERKKVRDDATARYREAQDAVERARAARDAARKALQGA